MKIVSQPVEFEWNTGNIEKNWRKHKVTYQEAEEVFGNEPLVLLTDSRHSTQEKRYHALGKTDGGRLLFASFTIRKDQVRVISIRPMNKKETHQYRHVDTEMRSL